MITAVDLAVGEAMDVPTHNDSVQLGRIDSTFMQVADSVKVACDHGYHAMISPFRHFETASIVNLSM